MLFCENCGMQIPQGAASCPSCNEPVGAAQPQPQPQQYQQPQEQPPPSAGQQPPPFAGQQPPPFAGQQPPYQQGYPPYGNAGAGQNDKTMSILAYIFFFVPLIAGAYKTSPSVKFHTNQGTLLFIVSAGYSIISIILNAVIKVNVITIFGIVRYTPLWLTAILGLLSLPLIGLCVLGIVNAVNDRMNPLPVIGNFTIIK